MNFNLLQALTAYRPLDDADELRRRRFLEFVQSHPDCAERALSLGHLTGAAWLMDPERRRVLLTFHRKLNRWLQLGGHADGELDLSAVALREAREESGIAAIKLLSVDIFDLDIHPIPAASGEPAHLHYDARFACQAESADFRVSSESHALEWIPVTELGRFSDEPSLLRMARKWDALEASLHRTGAPLAKTLP